MTPLEKYLAEIEERLAKATPAPWEAEFHSESPIENLHPFSFAVGPKHLSAPRNYNTLAAQNDSILIANSPTDLATLVAMVRRMHETLEEVREGSALMAEGEGNDPQTYMDMASCLMESCDEIFKGIDTILSKEEK